MPVVPLCETIRLTASLHTFVVSARRPQLMYSRFQSIGGIDAVPCAIGVVRKVTGRHFPPSLPCLELRPFKGPCPDRFAAHSRHIPNPGVCLEPSLAQLGKRTKNKTVTGLHCGKGRAHGPVCRIFLTPRPGRLTSLRPQSRFWGETLAKSCVGEGPKEGGRSGGRSLTPRRGALMTHVKCPGHFMPARFSPAIETGSLSGPSMLSHVRYLMT
jgi:hypothetical protein